MEINSINLIRGKRAVLGGLTGTFIATILIITMLFIFAFASGIVKKVSNQNKGLSFEDKLSGDEEMYRFDLVAEHQAILPLLLNCEFDLNDERIDGYDFLDQWDGNKDALEKFKKQCADDMSLIFIHKEKGFICTMEDKCYLSSEIDDPEASVILKIYRKRLIDQNNLLLANYESPKSDNMIFIGPNIYEIVIEEINMYNIK